MILDKLTNIEKQKLTIKHLNKDETLFYEGELCNHVGIVIKGALVISSYSYEGKEIIYNSLSNYDMFGNNLIFSSDPRYKGNVISKTKSTVCLIKESILIGLLQSNISFLEEYLEITSDFTKQLNSRIKLLSFTNTEKRFLYYLHINNHSISYHTISSLAGFLSMERETLSRLIAKLNKEGYISINKKDKKITLLKQ